MLETQRRYCFFLSALVLVCFIEHLSQKKTKKQKDFIYSPEELESDNFPFQKNISNALLQIWASTFFKSPLDENALTELLEIVHMGPFDTNELPKTGDSLLSSAQLPNIEVGVMQTSSTSGKITRKFDRQSGTWENQAVRVECGIVDPAFFVSYRMSAPDWKDKFEFFGGSVSETADGETVEHFFQTPLHKNFQSIARGEKISVNNESFCVGDKFEIDDAQYCLESFEFDQTTTAAQQFREQMKNVDDSEEASEDGDGVVVLMGESIDDFLSDSDSEGSEEAKEQIEELVEEFESNENVVLPNGFPPRLPKHASTGVPFIPACFAILRNLETGTRFVVHVEELSQFQQLEKSTVDFRLPVRFIPKFVCFCFCFFVLFCFVLFCFFAVHFQAKCCLGRML
jgi:hypothetical protein